MKTIKIISAFCVLALCCTFTSCRKQFPRIPEVPFAEPVVYTGDLCTDAAVDLGLSVDWASKNIGALRPEDSGYFYIWGQTKVYGDPSEFDKYSTPSYGTGTVLKPEHDIATQTYGASYRQPTLDEFKELIEKCTWLYASYNGVLGYVVTGSTGKSIFLPCANYWGPHGYAGPNGYFESTYDSGLYRSVNVSTSDSQYAKALSFSGKGIDTGDAHRKLACPVRPVIEITTP